MHGADQSGGHIERGAADGRGRAVAGLPADRILRAERRREAARSASHAVHGPREDEQTVVAVLLHRLRPPAPLRVHRKTLPPTRGKARKFPCR